MSVHNLGNGIELVQCSQTGRTLYRIDGRTVLSQLSFEGESEVNLMPRYNMDLQQTIDTLHCLAFAASRMVMGGVGETAKGTLPSFERVLSGERGE